MPWRYAALTPGGGTRTRTLLTEKRILSPLRLPIPPRPVNLHNLALQRDLSMVGVLMFFSAAEPVVACVRYLWFSRHPEMATHH